jgi:hypothetical protein
MRAGGAMSRAVSQVRPAGKADDERRTGAVQRLEFAVGITIFIIMSYNDRLGVSKAASDASARSW